MLTEKSTIILLLPELILIITAAWIYVGGTFLRHPTAWTSFAIASLLVAALALFRQNGAVSSLEVSGPLIVDQLAYSFRWLALVVGMLLVMIASRTSQSKLACESLGTLLFVIVGLMLVCEAGELIFLFLSLELISIPTYVLLFLGRKDQGSAEATIKYFFLSILSSGIFLYGLSFFYGLAGSTYLVDISAVLSAGENHVLLPIAMVLIFAGLSFKIAAVPFHFYAPDVYQGTTNINAALLAVVPKIAGIVALLRIAVACLPGSGDYAWQFCLIVAMLTMTIGNVAALWQTNLRRMLAYSSIAHAGYMLIGLTVALAVGQNSSSGFDAVAAMLFYTMVYVLATIGGFAALASLSSSEAEVSELKEIFGLGRSRPWVASALTVFMFSLSGLPPLAGFWGKLTLFTSTLGAAWTEGDSARSAWFIALAIVGALNAAIAAAYYLRVIGAMYFRSSEDRSSLAENKSRGALVATMFCGFAVVMIGLFPGPLMDNVRNASQHLSTNAQKTGQASHHRTVDHSLVKIVDQ